MRVHFSIWPASATAAESRSIGSGTIGLSKKYMIRASATKNIMILSIISAECSHHAVPTLTQIKAVAWITVGTLSRLGQIYSREMSVKGAISRRYRSCSVAGQGQPAPVVSADRYRPNPKRTSTPMAAATGTATNSPKKPNRYPKANNANISQTGFKWTRRPTRRGANT